VPIFILSQKLLGGLPADEDIPPADGSTPHPMPQAPFAPADEAHAAPDQAQQAPHGWPLWLHGQIQAQNLAPANVNLAGQNLGFIDNMIHGPPDLNLVPHNIPIDLNAQPHQLDEEDFLELNDLINPIDHLPGEDVVFALAAPNANVQPLNANVQPPVDVDMDQPEEMLSDLTITISSANTLSDESGFSVNGAAQHQQLHIGLALVPEILVDPVVNISPCYGPEQASFFYSREGTIAWSSYFKPDGALVDSVSVPAQWADFFTAKLLTPENFDWAKSLL
jgi:hypothetical protein